MAEDAPALTGSVVATDVDANAVLTYSISGNAPAGLTFNADGSYSFDPSNSVYQSLGVGQSATLTIPYTVSDGTASSAANLIITVTGTNDAPLAIANTGTVAEDATLSINAAGGVLANDTDVDTGDTKTVSAVSFGATTGTVGSAIAGTYGSLTLNADGSYSYTANSSAAQALGVGQSATDVFTYTVRDAAGATSSTTLALTVTGTNDAPVAVADAATAVEAGGVANTTAGTTPSGNVLANDTDVDTGDARTVSAVSGSAAGTVGGSTAGAYGTLVLNADGTYTYTVNNSSAAVQALRTSANTLTDTFTYTVRDAANATSSTTLTLTIQGANDAPVGVADTAAVTENATVSATAGSGVLANDTDVDSGDTRAVSAVSFGAVTGTVGSSLAGTYGTLTLNADGSYSYSANLTAADALAAGQTASDAFTYTVRDTAGATSSTTLSFTVTGTNDAPVNTVPGAQSTSEDTSKAITGLSIADLDVGTVTVTLSVLNGTLSVSGGTAGIAGTGTSTVTLTGTVAQINATLAANVTYVPTADFNGASTLTLTTNDGITTTVSTVPITVGAVTDIAADTASTTEDTPAAISVLANDSFANTGRTITAIDGNAITAGGAAVAVANGSVTLNASGVLTFTPTANYNGTTSFNYTVTSGGVTETASATVTVVAVNDAPVNTVPGAIAVTEDVATALTGISVSDVDAGSGSITVTLSVPAGTLAAASGSGVTVTGSGTGSLVLSGTQTSINSFIAASNVSYTTAANANGSVTLTVTTSDGGNTGSGGAQTDVDTIALDITAINDAPVNTVPATQTATEDTSKAITGLSIADVDADSGIMTATLAVTNGTLTVSGGSATIINSGTGTVTLIGTTAQINATLAANVNYVPTANFNGAATLTLITSDNGNTGSGGLLFDTDTVTINVAAVNDAPVNTVPASITVTEDVATAITGISVGDIDAASSTITVTLSVPAGTLAAASGSGVTVTGSGTGSLVLSGTQTSINSFIAASNVSYTTAANANGTVALTVTTSDGGNTGSGGAQTDTDTVTLNITNVNDAPVNTVPAAQTLAEDATRVFSAANGNAITVADVDGGSLTVVVSVAHGSLGAVAFAGATVTANNSGSVTIQGTAAAINGALNGLVYTPQPDYHGTETLSVATNDGGFVTTSSVPITITPVADIVADNGITVAEDTGTGVTIDVLGNDSFENAGRFISAINGSAIVAGGASVAVTNGTVALTTGGQLVFTPAPNYSGTASFDYTVNSNGTLETAAVNVTVSAVNDAPTIVAPASVTVTEDTPMAITGISVSDPDNAYAEAANRIASAQLQVSGGSLQVTLAGSATISAGANGSGNLTLSGSQADINSTLATLTYTPGANLTWQDTLNITTTDHGSPSWLSASASVLLPITAVNDAPSGTDRTITTNEDTGYQLTVGDFGYTDVDSYNLQSVTVYPSSAGTLTLNGVVVTGPTTVAIADLYNTFATQLVFTPAANANGTGYATVAFQVTDDGGAIDGTPATITFNVTAVNDAPEGRNATVTATEDTQFTFSLSNFLMNDVEQGNNLNPSTVRIDSLPASGSLLLNGVAVTAGQVISAANITSGLLRYTPAANANGSAAAGFTFSVGDAAGTYDAAPNTITIDITAVNDAPSGTNSTVTLNEDSFVNLTRAHFGFTDTADGNNFQSVTVNPSSAGTLTLNGVTVTAATVVTVAQLDAGLLRFAPAANANGTGYATVSFRVTDDGGTAGGGVNTDASANTLTFNVTPMTEAPVLDLDANDSSGATGADYITTFTEGGGTVRIAGGDRDITDVDSTTLTGATITLTNAQSGDVLSITPVPSGITATLSGNVLTLSGTANVTSYEDAIRNVRFNNTGNDPGSTARIITVTVTDGTNTSNVATTTINITEINDAPAGTNSTVTLNEDSFVNLTRANFGFTDTADNNNFQSVTVNASSAGTLTLNGVAITAATVVTVAQLDAGLLRFTPAANASGGAYATVSFRVTDDGGTANGGVNTDASANTLTFSVTAVADAPVLDLDANNSSGATGANYTVTFTENGAAVAIADTDRTITDVDSTAITGATITLTNAQSGDVLAASGLPGGITASVSGNVLTLSGSSTLANYQAALSAVTFNNTGNDPGTTARIITVTVTDGTTTSNVATTTVNVTAINDAPVMDLDANNSSGATGANYSTSYTENGAAVSIADADATLSDVDSATLTGATITLTNAQSGDVLAAGTLPSGITANVAGSVVTLSGTGSPADYLTAIRAITFNNTSESPSTTARTITISVTDGTTASNVGTTTVAVTALNDAPTATTSAVAGTEDTALVFTWADFNVSDVDTAIGSLGVRITTLPADGVLQTSTNGTTWTNVATNQLVSQATINSGFLRFVPDANESGDDSYGGSSVGNQQSDYARFTFTPNDGTVNGTAATMTIDIAPSADGASFTYNAAATTIGTLAAPASVGLTSDYFQAISTLTEGAMSSAPDTMETGIETAVATSSSLITNIGLAGTGSTGINLPIDDAYRMQGLVYLEAGKSYVFSGYADDTVRLEIGGNTLLSGNWGGGGQATAGTFTATSYTPTATGYYSFEFMVYNTSGPGNYELNVSINGAAVVDASTANLRLYQSINQLDAAGALHGAFIANGSEGGYYPVGTSSTGGTIHLAPLTVALVDTDGSEALTSVRMQDIAIGAVLSDGTHSFTATTGATTADITTWNRSQLTITPAAGTGEMNLRVVALSTETATGAVATSSLAITVNGTLLSEINTANADALLGQAGADTFNVSENGSGLAVAVSQGASGTIVAATGTETTATTSQEFSTGAGNDLVQSGAGNDTIYLGDSGSNNFPGTSTAATQAQVAATRLMTLADGAGSMTDASTGQLTTTADDTSASNTTAITTWADVANAGSGNDVVYGQAGTDFLYGAAGDDRLSGGAGIDGVRGGAGNDVLIGGAGNDVLRGDTGSDVFRWELADQGTTAAPASDIIIDFDTASAAAGGDVLDLRDLLQGEVTTAGAPGNLGNFLHFTYSGSDTIVQISTTGAFSGGFNASAVDQSITLQGVNLTSGLGSDQLIIQDLLNKSKLLVDGT